MNKGRMYFAMHPHWGSEDTEHKCTCVTGNPLNVHQHEGGLWWFTDETQANEFGGFCTQAEAEESAARYARQL